MAGQYYDAESTLFYNWNRYYNPATGRYISSDPIGLDGGINTFLYAAASPVMYIDPEGLQAAIACVGGPNPVCIAGIGQIVSWIAGGVGLAAVMSVPGDTPADNTTNETETCTKNPNDCPSSNPCPTDGSSNPNEPANNAPKPQDLKKYLRIKKQIKSHRNTDTKTPMKLSQAEERVKLTFIKIREPENIIFGTEKLHQQVNPYRSKHGKENFLYFYQLQRTS